jgi:hypothetical protein
MKSRPTFVKQVYQILGVKSAEICPKQIDVSGKQLGTMETLKHLMKVNTLW